MRTSDAPETIERVATARGELVLRRAGDAFEIISNGVFLMDTRSGESERLLVRAALDQWPVAGEASVLIGGLGVGFSLAEAIADARTGQVTVIECEPAVIRWHDSYLRPFSMGALERPETRVECADLLEWLRSVPETYDVICLDIDNGPDWTVTDRNAALYDDAGLELLAGRLRPDGVLAVWSASAAASFEARLRRVFRHVELHSVKVPRGEPDIVYIASVRR